MKVNGETSQRALEGLRVIEIAGQFGFYLGKLLADMGAEVILVESPQGAHARSALPLRPSGASGQDLDSLQFAYFNGGKKSVVLDLASAEGKQGLRALIESAHVLVESLAPASLESMGLSDASLWATTPHLVHCSITPFGSTGPYSNYCADDLTLLAMGGLLSLAGLAGSAPTQPHGNQAVLAADQFASAGVMAAVLFAEASGKGQRVDVSAQQCVIMGLENAVQYANLEGTVRKRGGSGRYAGGGIFPCEDGEVFVMAAGVGSPRFWKNSVAWLRSEGVDVRDIEDERWFEVSFLATDEAKETFNRIFRPFAASRTLKHLYHVGQKHGVPIAPMGSPVDLVANDQLNARGFFVPLQVDGLSAQALMPGAPYLMSQTPVSSGPPPRLGQHTSEILGALGCAKECAA